jgi:hypothetical protein
MADEGLKKTGVILVAEDAEAFKSAVTKATEALGQFGEKATESSKNVEGFGQIVTGALREIGAKGVEFAMKGIEALADGFKDLFTDAEKFEQINARLNNVITASGGAAGLTAEEARKLAEQYKDLAGGADETVLSIEEMALRMGTVSAQQMPDFIKTSLNLAAATGVDAASGARLLAQSYDDPVSALTRFNRMGIRVTDDVKEQITQMQKAGDTAGAFSLMIERLNQATSGAAQAQADTFAGKWAILSSHLADAGRSVMDRLLPPLEKLLTVVTPILTNLADAFSTQLGSIIDRAAVWGEAIINNLAAGMESAAQSVINVIQQLGSIIASWMAPGSPPKFLPQLDDWGKQAAQIWMQGFTNADMSGFNSLNSTVSNFLKSGGSMDNPQVQSYIRSLYTARDANAALAAAQENLNRVTAQYDAILTPLNNQLRAAQNTKTEADDAVKLMDLKRIAGDTSINQMERNKALAEIDVIQTQEKVNKTTLEKDIAVQSAKAKVDAAAEAQKLSQNQLDMQRQALELMTKQNDIMQQMAATSEKAAKGGGGGISGLGGLGAKLTADLTPKENPLQPLTDAVNLKIAEIRTAFAGMVANIQAELNHIQAIVSPPFENAFKTIQGIIATQMPIIQGNLKLGLDQMTIFWNNHKGEVGIIFDTMLAYISLQLSGAMTWAAAILSGGVTILSGIWAAFWLLVNGKTKEAWDTILKSIDAALQGILKVMGTDLETVRSSWQTVFGLLPTIVDKVFKDIKGAIDGWIAQVRSALQPLFDLIAKAASAVGAATGIKIPEPNASGTIPGRAAGGLAQRGVPAMFGEMGPELAVPAQDSWIFPAAQTSQIMSSIQNNNASHWNYAPVYNSAPPNPSVDFALMQVMAS